MNNDRESFISLLFLFYSFIIRFFTYLHTCLKFLNNFLHSSLPRSLKPLSLIVLIIPNVSMSVPHKFWDSSSFSYWNMLIYCTFLYSAAYILPFSYLSLPVFFRINVMPLNTHIHTQFHNNRFSGAKIVRLHKRILFLSCFSTKKR